jgi:regulator of sirC expression with transglutaminase-like and TPR domain
MNSKSISGANEIRALISLLGDDNAEIRGIARERLLHHGQEAADYLREACAADGEGRVRIEARHVLEQINLEDLLGSFHLISLLGEPHLDLEKGAVLLARFGDPALRSETCKLQLDELADRVRLRLPSRTPSDSTIRLLNHYLFYEEGFTGNTDDYYNPDNSFISRVLEFRRGIPVSLSVIYLLIARRLNLPIVGIGMPVHFICKFENGANSFYIDPFNQGQIMNRADCMQFLRRSGYPFKENFLARTSDRDILIRMARNLILVYTQYNEPHKVAVLERIITILKAYDSEIVI